MIVRRPQPGRLTLGRYGRSLLAAGERQSVIVVAPTQSHKTTGLAIPALLEWEGPVLATSVKTDLLLDTLAHRESKGKVMIFDPARTTDLPRGLVADDENDQAATPDAFAVLNFIAAKRLEQPRLTVVDAVHFSSVASE
ncbi:MAG TPA: type IV secretory system conjugative DNA transfer family protein [Solirubrobacterales bacterium]|nr:type IV secretory system conjugative DNA transfer family protein [Solirubrobacterales bacterium]